MRYSPFLLLHIAGGIVGLLSGAVAMSFRKGSRGHGVAGNVFFVSMMIMSGLGAGMAIMKSQPGNILGGTITFYLVATAWITARRKDNATGIFDWGGLVVAMGVAAVELTYAFEAVTSSTGLKYDYPPGPYIMMGTVAVIASVGDIRMLIRGGVSGTQRVARHLWRMCFALFIASASVFLARQHLFPELLRKTGVLIFLSVLPLILMIYWLIRVSYSKAYKKMVSPARMEFVRAGLLPHVS